MAPELLQQWDAALASPPPPPTAAAKAGGGAAADGVGLAGDTVAACSFDSRMSDVW